MTFYTFTIYMHMHMWHAQLLSRVQLFTTQRSIAGQGQNPGWYPSVHEILQARILEWLSSSSSRDLPGGKTHVFCVSCISS